MKKSISLAIFAISFSPLVFAYPVFSSAGLPAPGSGITIVPEKMMNLSPEMRRAESKGRAQQKAKGYIEEESSYPKYLIKMGKLGAEDINKNNDPYDTHMKYSPSQIKLAFEYKPTTAIKTSNVIGFAAGGLYIKDLGWTGIAEFFNAKDIGTCKYNLDNMKVANGAVQISAESVRYDINKKPTDIFVKGSINAGYIYSISWFDPVYQHTLECANMNYDDRTMTRMISLARNIDMA